MDKSVNELVDNMYQAWTQEVLDKMITHTHLTLLQ